jgi:hypothetical protein
MLVRKWRMEDVGKHSWVSAAVFHSHWKWPLNVTDVALFGNAQLKEHQSLFCLID